MKINQSDCISCGQCVEICPARAIEYNRACAGYKQAVINQDLCIDCGLCKKTCPGECIS